MRDGEIGVSDWSNAARDGDEEIGLCIGELLKLWRLEMVVFGLGFRSMGAKQTCESKLVQFSCGAARQLMIRKWRERLEESVSSLCAKEGV